MITFDYFPGGVKNCVTFSYDDGPGDDMRLSQLFNKYGLKATFNINVPGYFRFNDETSLKARYSGHEIACHGISHLSLDNVSKPAVINEIFGERKLLEKYTGYPVVGMAYANGRTSKESVEILKSCGIVYSRTTGDTRDFKLPQDFMYWHPTCHHSRGGGGLECARRFIDSFDGYFSGPRLLYIWGHSFEFRTEKDWENIEEICKTVANNSEIWYATNIEIYRYITALKSLVISANEDIVYNPTAIDVWIAHNRKPVKICAGETVKL